MNRKILYSSIIYNLFRRGFYRVVFTFIALLSVQGLISVVFAQVVVDNKLTQSEILIGEQTTLTTTVTVNRGQCVEFPNYASGDTIVPGVEILSAGKIDSLTLNKGKRMQLVRHYVITSFDSALYSIPGIEVIVDGKTYKSNVNMGLKVNTVDVDMKHVDQFAQPFDVLDATFVWNNKLLYCGILLWALMAFVFYGAIKLSKKKPRRKMVVIQPPMPPYKKASESLNALHKVIADDLTPEQNKQFFVSLTDVVRRFLSERYSIHATERTSLELVGCLKNDIDEGSLGILKDILQMSDNVKFAKFTATQQQRLTMLGHVDNLLLSLRDENMEQPQPIVKYVTYTDVQQHRLRMIYWSVMIVSFIMVLALFTWMVMELLAMYF